MLLIQIAGWALLMAAAWQALRIWTLDREMQRYRVPNASPAAYFFIPIRWQRRLYTEPGQRLVVQAWWTLLRMYAFGFAAMFVLALASAAG